MKRLMSSLHFTRWLRVVAVAGVVWATAVSVEPAAADDTASAPSYAASARTANTWCARC